MKTKFDYNDLFINKNLPSPLSNDEIIELFVMANAGNKYAKDKIITHNIRLVISRVLSCFNDTFYDKKDLISIGNIGLMKAVDTFDINKNVKFNSYAIKCIDNEILMFFRKLKGDKNVDSIEESTMNCEGCSIYIKDILKDNTNLEEEYIDKELYDFLHKLIMNLPESNRKAIIMFFGFYGNKRHTQQEIGEVLNISQSAVSLKIRNTLKLFAKLLERNEFAARSKTKRKKLK